MQQQTSTTNTSSGGGTLHNISEKIKHPFTHDTDTNVTYHTREQKKLAETNPQLANSLGVKDAGLPPHSSSTTTTGTTLLNQQPSSTVPSTHTSTIPREEVYMEKKWD